jgi:hypothetical protein
VRTVDGAAVVRVRPDDVVSAGVERRKLSFVGVEFRVTDASDHHETRERKTQ